MRTFHVVALVLCVVVAGCAGPPGSATGTAEPSDAPSATTAGADGSSTAASSFEYPPGYGPAGVTNGSRAAQTHTARLDGRQRYRLHVDSQYTRGGERGNLSYTWTQGPTAARANYTRYNVSSAETVGVWKQGDTLRVSRGSGPYPRLPKSKFVTVDGDVRLFPVTGFLDERFAYARGTLYRLNASTSDATVVTRGGERLLRVRTTTPPPTPNRNVSYHSFELTLWVDQSGLVQRVERRATRTRRGQRSRDRTTARLVTENVPRPRQPTWLDRSANVTARMDAGLLVVEHRGGATVPFAGPTPVVGDGDGRRSVRLNGSLAPGDTVFVYRRAEDGRLTASRTRPNQNQYRQVSGGLSFLAGNETVGVTVGAGG
jgi:hypothetical protein